MAEDSDDVAALRELAKEAGIKSWHVKSADTLQKELDALTGGENKPQVAGILQEEAAPEADAKPAVAPEQPAVQEIPAPVSVPAQRRLMVKKSTGERLWVWSSDIEQYEAQGFQLA